MRHSIDLMDIDAFESAMAMLREIILEGKSKLLEKYAKKR